MTKLPDHGDALRIAAFLESHPGWSAFWDKQRRGLAGGRRRPHLRAVRGKRGAPTRCSTTWPRTLNGTYGMIVVNKRLLSGTPDDVRATVEYLARDQDDHEYLAGTWLRELAVKLAACDGLTVSAVSYDDTAGYELEVTLVSAPHHDPIVIGRSQAGDHCQITLERWLPIERRTGH